MTSQVERLTAALATLADLIEVDDVYVPIFQRLDAELTTAMGGHESRIAAARRKIAASR